MFTHYVLWGFSGTVGGIAPTIVNLTVDGGEW